MSWACAPLNRYNGHDTKHSTVEPRYNDLRYNDISDVTINIFQPGQRYSKMYGTKPRFKINPKRKINPNITITAIDISTTPENNRFLFVCI